MDADHRDPSRPDRRTLIRRPGGRRETDPQPEWVSTVAYGRIYGIDARTVRKWVDAGLLQTYRVKQTIRVRNVPPQEPP
jgi:hypothetical protein